MAEMQKRTLALGVVLLLSLSVGVAAEPEVPPPTTPNLAAPARNPKATDAKIGSLALSRFIDQEIHQRLKAEGVAGAAPADDAEFLRRVYLDIAGVIPTPGQAAAFLDSKDPDRRARLIDELLDSPRYAQHMADIWKALLIPNTAASLRRRHEPMILWLEDTFARNMPWNQLVAEVVTSTGMQDENGAVTFYVTHESVDQLADRISRVFLGVQLQCAQCHDHPLASWKQTDYWGLAAFFTRVRPQYARDSNNRERYGTAETGTRKPLMVPPSALTVPPRFLRGEAPRLDDSGPYRPALAEWMTSPQNSYFARAKVNRIWHHFFGRGLVNPVDDMHEGNPPSHPELLDQLARRFAEGNFDLKHLIRGICNSQTYQRTSRPSEGNEEDTTLFSHMAIKVLSPHQLYDSLELVLNMGNPGAVPPRPRSAEELRKWLAGRNGFVDFFSPEEGAEPTEYLAGIPQALRLMNSSQTNRVTRVVSELVKRQSEPAALIEQLFLATLSRRPTPAEAQKMLAHVNHQADRNRALTDILWALLNCTEFVANH